MHLVWHAIFDTLWQGFLCTYGDWLRVRRMVGEQWLKKRLTLGATDGVRLISSLRHVCEVFCLLIECWRREKWYDRKEPLGKPERPTYIPPSSSIWRPRPRCKDEPTITS